MNDCIASLIVGLAIGGSVALVFAINYIGQSRIVDLLEKELNHQTRMRFEAERRKAQWMNKYFDEALEHAKDVEQGRRVG